MGATLVIMAAGLGSRYGGNKQVEGIGPNGEMLMEYGIYDALRAGFRKVVFIIKPDMEPLMERLCVAQLRRQRTADGAPVEAVYALQDFSFLPAFYAPPPGREKPFGTVHAMLCAEAAVDEPFCVMNADDFYGAGAYQAMYRALRRLPESGRAAMVGYLLRNTASVHGTVSRGVCDAAEGELRAIRETKQIQLYPDGTLRDLAADRALDPDAVVSMNFWGFAPSIFREARTYFEDFLRGPGGSDPKAECLLPVMVGDLLARRSLTVEVLSSGERWFGMTYREDRDAAAAALRELHGRGVYPARLWS